MPHSYKNGIPNLENIEHDTKVARVLIGDEFYYWGGSGPVIPDEFRKYRECNVCCSRREYKCRFPPSLVGSFIEWIRTRKDRGYINDPAEFIRK